MYGTILKLGMKAAPHVAKLALPAYAGTAVVNQFAPDFIKDAYKGSIEGDEDGVYKGKGLTAAFLKPFVDEGALESAKQQQSVKRQLTALGEDASQYNLGEGATIYDAQGAVATKVRERAEQQRRQERIDALKPLEMQYAEARGARADAMLMNANSLAFQREQLAQQDRQYNRDIERQTELEKERAFLALMGAGLSGVEAAFV